MIVEQILREQGIQNAGQSKFPFEVPVDINGLPYVFKGEMPFVPTSFDWHLLVPGIDYNDLAASRRLFGTEDGYFAYREGGAGFINVSAYREPLFHLVTIRSTTPHFPKASSYYEAKGIGRFLLSNLTRLAEIRKLPLYVNPSGKTDEHTERLSDWYRRNGFRNLSPEEEKMWAKMVRDPNPKTDD
jgi:hypothetical protein